MNTPNAMKYGARSFRYLFTLGLIALIGGSAFAQLGINDQGITPVPHPSAMLDLNSTTRGLLVPRMSAVQRNAIPTPAEGLLVFVFPGSGTNPKGFWYYDADPPINGWTVVGSGGQSWTLGGNTAVTTSIIGTTDNQAFVVRSDGTERMRISAGASPNDGLVGVGTTAPRELLEVNGGLQITGAGVGNVEGTIRFNATTNAHDGNVDNTASWYQLENVFDMEEDEDYYSDPLPTCAYAANGALYPVIDNASFANTTTFGTLESPYGRLWEDARTQYLYFASDLAALSICENTDIIGAGFNVTSGAGGMTITNFEVKMKNTAAIVLPTFENGGFTNCHFSNFLPAGGWNVHAFNVAPFQWNGIFNVIVETCHDMNDWTGNVNVSAENTNYPAYFGAYCDACGHMFTPGSTTCYFDNCVARNPVPNPGGVLCLGYGHTPGCGLLASSTRTTCDGTFQWQGGIGGGNKRPLLKLNAQINTTAIVLSQGDYIWSQYAVMVGDQPWATSGALPNQKFKGPGTLSAKVGVWGGNVLLSDHVFDMYYDGRPHPEDVERVRGYEHYPIQEMANYVERERHLPTIDGREKWNTEGRFSLDDLSTQLWVTVEEQALYIKELNERMEVLRKHLVRQKLEEIQKGK